MHALHLAFTGSPEFEASTTFYKSPSQASVNKLWEIESPQHNSNSNLAKTSSSSSNTTLNNSSSSTVRSFCVLRIQLMNDADYCIVFQSCLLTFMASLCIIHNHVVCLCFSPIVQKNDTMVMRRMS